MKELDLSTIRFIRQTFDLYSDHSTNCLGYKMLTSLEKQISEGFKHVSTVNMRVFFENLFNKTPESEFVNEINFLVSKGTKIDRVISKLSKIQIELMDCKLSNDKYNELSEQLGDIKENLANL